MEIIDVSFLLRGKNRVRILEALNAEPKTNSYLSRELKISISNVRPILRELTAKGFIKCRNPEDFHYKLYEITAKGKTNLEKIQELNL